MKAEQLENISVRECCLIAGGADKAAQSALYYIGYAIGFLVRCIANLFSGKSPQVEEAL